MATLLMVGRSVGSLVVVVGLVVLFGRFARKRAMGKGGAAGFQPLIVETKMSLGKGQSVVVLRDGGARLVLGVTPQQISILRETEALDVEVGTVNHTVETLDLRELEDPELALAHQWGQRQSSWGSRSVPEYTGSQGPSWMAFLALLKGALVKR